MITENTLARELEDKIYQLALGEHSEFKEISEAKFREVIGMALREIEELESVRYKQGRIVPNISTLWVFSGPGTYDGIFLNDRYEDTLWNRGMDRTRVDYAVWLAEHAENSLTIIYNGSDQQNSILREVIKRGDIKIPNERIIITGEGMNNTVDQIRSFVLPLHLYKPGGKIGLVSHAPHLMRVMHTLNHFKTIPEDMTVHLFPIATTQSEKEEYAISEIKALLYYIFIAKDATVSTYPCIK